jgi:hypothetical protein
MSRTILATVGLLAALAIAAVGVTAAAPVDRSASVRQRTQPRC